MFFLYEKRICCQECCIFKKLIQIRCFLGKVIEAMAVEIERELKEAEMYCEKAVQMYNLQVNQTVSKCGLRMVSKNVGRPTLQEGFRSYDEKCVGKSMYCPKGKNKGRAGQYLEEQLGVPQSSECLDFKDGELKAFPLVPLKKGMRIGTSFGLREGDNVPKETVAITMVKTSDLPHTSFSESRLRKKISNVLFTPYSRNGDDITWHEGREFNSEHPLWDEIRRDYETIQEFYAEHGYTKSGVGKWIQVRTKGAGKSAPKTHAFYFRKEFMMSIFN